MLNKKVILGLVAGAVVSAVSSAALADVVPGPYAGVQLGYGDNHANYGDSVINNGLLVVDPFNSNPIDLINETISTSLDHSAFAGRLYAGYDFNRFLAVEAGYTRFSNTNIQITDVVTDSVTNQTIAASKVSGHYETQAADAVGKIHAPIADGFGLYAKAGVDYLDTKVSIAGGSASENNVGLVYGLGTDYQISPHLVADISFTRFNGDNDPNSNHYQPNADFYAAGLTYKFNA